MPAAFHGQTFTQRDTMPSTKKNEILSFEDAMQELENLVDEMEKGELPLEKALEKFERGVSLARSSQTILKDAEQKVQILMNQNGQDVLQPLTSEDEDN